MGAVLLADFTAMPSAHRNLIWMTFLDPPTGLFCTTGKR
jgi:hypothetical protein